MGGKEMATSLDGKVALITGSGGGMGRSHALLMAERGADIIIHDIKEDGANETAEMVRSHGRKATVMIADSRDIPAFTAKRQTARSIFWSIMPGSVAISCRSKASTRRPTI
jgi:NAD(P)-dependent dehydrogenase (short-subunit alcohol dehydrogenase family)